VKFNLQNGKKSGHASQHKTKTICSTKLGTKFQKFNEVIYGRFFSPYNTLLFTSSLNFSSEKKNAKDSSGAFIGQENGY